MRGSKVRKLAILITLAALVSLLVKKLRGDPAPQFSNHPTVTGGPAAARRPAATPDPLPDLVPAPEDPTVPAAAEPALVAAPMDPTVPEAAASAAPAAEQAWVDAVDSGCPEGYPVKAKVKSGIFHVPGTPTYERTKPDRCYPSAEAAEADSLRPPKR